MAEFGAVVRHHRIAAGLSQRAVAVRAGLSERAVRDIERGGTTRPRPHSIRLLAGALGLDGDALGAFLVAAHADGRPDRPAVLAAAPTGFVGRRDELRALLDLAAGGRHRMITVLGPAGVGKSRLVAELVPGLRRGGYDVRTLDLSAVTDHRLVAERIAEVVDGGTTRGSAIEQIRIQVGSRRLILVLDAMERLVAAVPALATLLRHCAGLTILVTSQRRLNAQGERLFPLGPLPPDDAAALFRQRATAVAPSAAVALDRAVVLRICAAVDHLPLAVELAAARTHLFSGDELLDRLKRPLDVLTGGAADLPAHHRSLRDAITTTLASTGTRAQDVFAWLAASVGGIRADDLDRLLRRLTAHVDEALDALGELVDAGLVRVRRDGSVTRYVMANAVAEVARERLASRADRLRAEGAVAGIYLDRLRAVTAPDGGPPDSGPARPVTTAFLDRAACAALDADADTVRAALFWAARHMPAAVDQPTVEAVYRYCEERGRFVEGRRTLVALADAEVAGAAWALAAAGTMSRLLHDPDGARDLLHRGRRVLRAGDHIAGAALEMLEGSLASESDDLLGAARHMERARDLAVMGNDWRTAGRALHNLGAVAELTGDLGRAEEFYRQALVARRRAGARDNDLGITLMNLGGVALSLRDWAMAAAHAAEAAERFGQGGHPRFQALSLSTVAIAELAGGAHTEDRSGAGAVTSPRRGSRPDRPSDGRPFTDASLAGARRAIDAALGLLDAFGDETPHRGLVEARASIVRHACGDLTGVDDQLRRGLEAMTHGLPPYEIPAVLDAHAALALRADPVAAARLLGLADAVRRGQPHPHPALLYERDEVDTRCRALLGAVAAEREYAHGAARVAHGVPRAAAALLADAVRAATR
ncbi:ATP-binding protein [Plantactinospora sp. GCM10030261]|uniref:ATP-binding protein n=1 Tax=Plantactinospora sp. GCM10030261 TaxID=3273420 RepID=UPI00361C604C